MIKKTLILTALCAVAAGSQAQSNRLLDGSASKLLADSVTEAREKAPFGITLNQAQGAACVQAHRSIAGLTPAQKFDALPSYDCQAWYANSKYQGLFTAAVIPGPDQYQAYRDDVARVRLVASKVDSLNYVRTAVLAHPDLVDTLPPTFRALARQLQSLDTLPATLSAIYADVALAEQANPMVPPAYRGAAAPKPIVAQLETDKEREDRLLNGGKPVYKPAPVAKEITSGEISARVMAAYKPLPKLSAHGLAYYYYLEFAAQDATTQAASARYHAGRYRRALADLAKLERQLAEQPDKPPYPWALAAARNEAAKWADTIALYQALSKEPGCSPWVSEFLVKALAVADTQ